MNDSEIMEMVDQFIPKIKKCLSFTPYQERIDLEQEIKMKIIEKLHTVEFREPKSIWEFLNIEI